MGLRILGLRRETVKPVTRCANRVLNESLSFVELILVAEGNRVMDPMTFELIVEDNKPGIRLVSDDDEEW
jgi:hypothetical protein